MSGAHRPLVAVVAYHLPPGRVQGWERGAFAVPERYVWALHRAGARPVVLTTADPQPPPEVLAPFAGLVLAGGGDLVADHYGQPVHPANDGMEPDRDRVELALVQAAVDAGLPTLAVCRGVQVLNVAFGGTLHQHLPDGDGPGHGSLHKRAPGDESGEPTGESGGLTVHPVTVASHSRLAAACGERVEGCVSQHHQGIDRVGRDLVAVAWADDGLVEAIEHRHGWTVGVQWHPEHTAEHDVVHQALFDAFVQEAGRRSLAR